MQVIMNNSRQSERSNAKGNSGKSMTSQWLGRQRQHLDDNAAWLLRNIAPVCRPPFQISAEGLAALQIVETRVCVRAQHKEHRQLRVIVAIVTDHACTARTVNMVSAR